MSDALVCGETATSPGECVVPPCCANNTLDAVRSICWQLESFLEQYVATQCHDPRMSDDGCVQSPPTTLQATVCVDGEEHLKVNAGHGNRVYGVAATAPSVSRGVHCPSNLSLLIQPHEQVVPRQWHMTRHACMQLCSFRVDVQKSPYSMATFKLFPPS